eukprot:scaffold157026_cov25-Prasinocladus_malaysianus.AAC.1
MPWTADSAILIRDPARGLQCCANAENRCVATVSRRIHAVALALRHGCRLTVHLYITQLSSMSLDVRSIA